jgi:hypothetical protein
MTHLYKSNVYLDKENIIHWDSELEEQPGQENAMQEIMDKILKLAREVQGRVMVIIDFRKASNPTAKTRKIVAEALKSGPFEKVAIWGTSIFIKTVAKFIISVAGVDFVRFFDSEAEAIKWLKE